MNQYTLFVLLSPFGCAIVIVFAFYAWRHRGARITRPLVYILSSVGAYLVFNTLELVDPTPQGTLFFAEVCYLCISVLTINWLDFSLVLTNREYMLKKKYVALLWIIPVVSAGLVFTNSYHHLIWAQYTFMPVSNGYLHMQVITYGGWFWVFWIYAYLLIIVGSVFMLWSSLPQRRGLRVPSLLTAIAALLPLIINLVYVLHLFPGFYKDYSPLAYASSGILLAISIFHYHLFDLTPFARAVLIDNMNDGMLTLNTAKMVVDFNPAAQRIFQNASGASLEIGKDFPLLNPFLNQFDTDPSLDLLQSEFNLVKIEEENYYDLQIRRLRDQYSGDMVGFLALMHSITEHKRLLRAVQKLAEEDALTGVLNRNRFTELARNEIENMESSPISISILMVDIDHFKEVNDSLGHIAGDQVLQAFVDRLRGWLRGTDLIGRIGGDEFVVLLANTPIENAVQLAKRLCGLVAAKPMAIKENQMIPITISIGVAEYTGNFSESLDRIISSADRALYEAKAQGRNRVFRYDSSLETKW